MLESLEQLRPKAARTSVLNYWSPPIVWMAALFFFSTDAFSGKNTGSTLWDILRFIYPGITEDSFDSIHFYIRKSAHFTGYAILASLLFRAFRSGDDARWRWKWAFSSLLIAASYALLDEYHQTFTRHRGGSIYDSLIDTSGAMTALVVLRLLATEAQRHRDKKT